MLVSDFSFDLPEERIAQAPVQPRDSCRLMFFDRETGRLRHHLFRELAALLRPGDCLVINETRVLKARLFGTVTGKSAKAVEIMLLRQLASPLTWRALVRPGPRLTAGSVVAINDGDGVVATIVRRLENGQAELRFAGLDPGEFSAWLAGSGATPLPPYIKTRITQDADYQTVYAVVDGSVAAPTAGLHFTPAVLSSLAARQVAVAKVVLHVGYGTFAPLRAQVVADNRMDAEHFQVSADAAETINRHRESGGRIVAVGTSVTRTLETVSSAGGVVAPGQGWADLFVYPGYRFRVVDGLITNFHLPGSSTLLLASAVADWSSLASAYDTAVKMGYRFYSFGDAMMII